jgi:hypothetical protein
MSLRSPTGHETASPPNVSIGGPVPNPLDSRLKHAGMTDLVMPQSNPGSGYSVVQFSFDLPQSAFRNPKSAIPKSRPLTSDL